MRPEATNYDEIILENPICLINRVLATKKINGFVLNLYTLF